MNFRLTPPTGKCTFIHFPVGRAIIAATPPERPRFSQTDDTGPTPSPLEYSLREACLPELNARLRAEGFEPPGKGLAAWVRLARILQVDAVIISVSMVN